MKHLLNCFVIFWFIYLYKLQWKFNMEKLNINFVHTCTGLYIKKTQYWERKVKVAAIFVCKDMFPKGPLYPFWQKSLFFPSWMSYTCSWFYFYLFKVSLLFSDMEKKKLLIQKFWWWSLPQYFKGTFEITRGTVANPSNYRKWLQK